MEVFLLLGSHVHQDFLVDRDFEEACREAILDLAPASRPTLREELDVLESGRYSDTELYELWRSSGAEYFFAPEDMPQLISLLKRLTDSALTEDG